MQVAVIGAASCAEEVYQIAEKLGRLLAEAGHTIICGGMGGVMEAACRGAHAAGGHTVGILPGTDISDSNPFLKVKIATGMGIGRNIVIIHSADVVIAVNGGYGTLSEIAYSLQLRKTVIGIDTWQISPEIVPARDAMHAIEILNDLSHESN